MRIQYLLAVALIGCASSPGQKPTGTKPEPAYVRHITSKTHLLYTYKLRQDGATGYELAGTDAEKVCQAKWNLHAYEFTQPTCVTNDSNQTTCSVTFRCQ